MLHSRDFFFNNADNNNTKNHIHDPPNNFRQILIIYHNYPPHNIREFSLYSWYGGWSEISNFQIDARIAYSQSGTISLAEPHNENIFARELSQTGSSTEGILEQQVDVKFCVESKNFI